MLGSDHSHSGVHRIRRSQISNWALLDRVTRNVSKKTNCIVITWDRWQSTASDKTAALTRKILEDGLLNLTWVMPGKKSKYQILAGIKKKGKTRAHSAPLQKVAEVKIKLSPIRIRAWKRAGWLPKRTALQRQSGRKQMPFRET